MKSIREIRTTLGFHPQEINSSIGLFSKNKIDYDVFLPTLGKNLQRDFVWSINQKRELVWSILMNRHIPRIAMINVVEDTTDDTDGVYQIIDGKQRLSSMIGFYNGDFTLLIDDKEYYYNEFPIDYQRVIKGYMFSYYIVNEDYGNKITDQQKIDWFKYINFAGTPQDEEHFESLKIK